MAEFKTIEGAAIPLPLREIPQAPTKLYIKGTMPDSNLTHLAVVGSRKYSSYGEQACRQLIAGLAGYPVVIVSGLALGIDSIAHRAALEVGLTTLAFPGSGLEEKILYPKQHLQLAREIVGKGGALISEFEPTQIGAYWTFPRRNRLMAGLCRATLVIEAERPSGTLITSRLATEYNRDVLAVPGSIFSPTSAGPNWLIGQGATPISSSEDLICALGLEARDTTADIEKFADLPPDELKLIEILKLAGSQARDLLIEQSALATTTANAALSMLEIKGLIIERGGEFSLQ